MAGRHIERGMAWLRTSAAFGALWATLPAAAAAEPSARYDDVPTRPQPAAPAPSRAAPAEQRYWSTTAAEHLCDRAFTFEQRGQLERALVAYTEALNIDPTYGPAWLGLGRLRASLRDYAEADRVLTAAARVPHLMPDALTERASVRRRAGRHADARADLELAIQLEPTYERVRELSSWYIEERAWPAALALWRRWAAALGETRGSAAHDEALLQVKALTVLAGETDPALRGKEERNWVRRALASIARRPR
jgi:tetratricopeptide (TPR) repeat protein